MSRNRLATTSALLLVVVFTASSVAPRALADDANKAAAEQLFTDAKTLMDLSKFAEACPKLEQSQKLDPGSGTLARLAYCYAHTGKLARAWSTYREALASAKAAGNIKRVDFIIGELADLEPRLSRLTVVLPKGATELVIELDGQAFVAGSAVPVDGGTHALVVSGKGKKPWESAIEIAPEKDAKTVTVPALDASTDESTTNEKHVPTMAYVFVGAGAVFTLAAVGARLAVSAGLDDRQAQCATQLATACDDVGKSKVRTWEGISFVTGGLALASFGAAIYLYAATPSKEQPKPTAFVRVSPTLGGLQLQGAF